MHEDDPAPASLSARAGSGLRAWTAAGDWMVTLGFAPFILLAPLATLGGAAWLTAQARKDVAAIEAREAPRLAAVRAADAARVELAPLLARPGFGAALEAIARALPVEASLVSAELRGGRLAIEVMAPDPDRLRAALRREPVLAGLRDTGQRKTDGGIVVRLEGAP